MITRPLLAATLENLGDIKYPCYVTQKLDGIRALKVGGRVISRKFLPIPNHHIRLEMEQYLPEGVDGEIVVAGLSFNELQSSVMTEEGVPYFEYWIFDYVKDSLHVPYIERMQQLNNLRLETPFPITRLIPQVILNLEEFIQAEKYYVGAGYEGVMLRSGGGPYKCGRSTLKEGYLLKFKRFHDSEAVVWGFVEQLENTNIKVKDEFGLAKRSHEKAGKVPKNTLGALRVKDCYTGIEFEVGTGFTDEVRKQIWNNKLKYLKKIINYRCQKFGEKNKPRFPSFVGFRSSLDLE